VISSLTDWAFDGSLEWPRSRQVAKVRGFYAGNQLFFIDPELTSGSGPYVFNELKHAFLLSNEEGVLLVGTDGEQKRPLWARRKTEGARPAATWTEWPSESEVTEPQLLAYLRLRSAKAELTRDGYKRAALARQGNDPDAALSMLRLELRERERRLGDAELAPNQRELLDRLVDDLFEVRLVGDAPTLVARADPKLLAEARRRYGLLADRLLAHQALLLTTGW